MDYTLRTCEECNILFMEYHEVRFILTTWRGAKRTQGSFIIDYYLATRHRIAGKTVQFYEEKAFFHHNNQPARTFVVATTKLIELGYELVTGFINRIVQIWFRASSFCFQT